MWIIVKRSRDATTPYSGPYCGWAGVDPGTYYLDYGMAYKDSLKLNKVNPVGFTVIKLNEIVDNTNR